MDNKVENKKQAIIVLHEIYGVNEFIQEQCQKFREAGYDVFCPNIINKSPFLYEKSEEAYDYFMKNVSFEVYKEVSIFVDKLKKNTIMYLLLVLVWEQPLHGDAVKILCVVVLYLAMARV